FLSDNTYPGLPAKDILYSSTATDETQTNWNGILGYLRLRVEEPVFVPAVRVYPTVQDAAAQTILNLRIELSAANAWSGRLHIVSSALQEETVIEADILAGRTELAVGPLALAKDARRWDENEGECCELTVQPEGLSPRTVRFGIRSFGANREGRLCLNGRTIFLRGEANCAEFPESGHEPMTEQEWLTALRMYRRYGVNCVRFHSHCPPEAAFAAADRLGMLLQPELSCWNPENAFLSEESFAYYRTELRELLLFLANHPSFVMLSFGNELQTDERGHERMRQLLREAHALDSTRLIADGSNNHYGGRGCEAESDFYAAQSCLGSDLRGTFANMEGYINQKYPSASADYRASMKKLREQYKKPVFGFEVGQFEVLPDFGELDCFCGVTEPANLRMIQERVRERGITREEWHRQVAATGELALIGYREEVEAVLRTDEMSGLSLLGLQDFPGQGTALVGMMNSHLMPKPYPFARPERFRSFFREQLPLVLLDRYTYENTECLTASVLAANYGKRDIRGRLHAVLSGDGIRLENIAEGNKGAGEDTEICCPCGKLTKVGELVFSLQTIQKPSRLDLLVEIGGMKNRYPIWVYPSVTPKCPDSVYETRCFDRAAEQVLENGGIVYLAPDSTKESLPKSIKAQFTTDFWSVGTFAGQEGGMGQLIAEKHPLFRSFPTEFHTNWQWWAMAGQRAVILPERMETIVAELDSYAYLRPMAQLFECRCRNGRLLFSSFGLQNLQQYPECRALQNSIYTYLASEEFRPAQTVAPERIAELVKEEA
ncbi:MAG: hypothetical protein K2N94_09830, partial [Lachnospiraceae bacterium]|nr:hypothetical protein [Lachnospiraceae bacterium]